MSVRLKPDLLQLEDDHVGMPYPFHRAVAGHPTWAFRSILYCGISRMQYIWSSDYYKYQIRRTLRTLSDIGLPTIKPGHRGGMSRANFTWTEHAYLPPTLNLCEHDAINKIAGRLV